MLSQINLVRTDSDNTDFRSLVTELDKELWIRDGAEHAFYAQFNKIDMIKYAVVAFENDEPTGCGAIKHYSEGVMEVKRMFVPENKRGMGIASRILAELETWARELGYKKCILETGKNQPEAIGLYKKNNYHITLNFGQYENVENSVCFEKIIS